MEFNINELHENLATELLEWYDEQGFSILNRIHESNLFAYPENEIEHILDLFKEEWNDLSIDERVDYYNRYKDLKL